MSPCLLLLFPGPPPLLFLFPPSPCNVLKLQGVVWVHLQDVYFSLPLLLPYAGISLCRRAERNAALLPFSLKYLPCSSLRHPAGRTGSGVRHLFVCTTSQQNLGPGGRELTSPHVSHPCSWELEPVCVTGVIRDNSVSSPCSYLFPVKLSDESDSHQTETSSQVKDNKVSLGCSLWGRKSRTHNSLGMCAHE